MLVNEGMFKKKKKQHKPKPTKTPNKSKKKQNRQKKKKITKITIWKFFHLGTAFKLRTLMYILKAPHLKKKSVVFNSQ